MDYHNHKISLFRLFLLLTGGIILLFVVGPLMAMFLATSPAKIFETVNDKEAMDSIALSLKISLFTTLFFALLAIPFAYFLARSKSRWKSLINGLIDIPIIIPHSAAGIALLGFVSRDSFIGQGASAIGLNFISNPLGIAIAMAFVSIPFLINAARDGFEAVPIRLEQTARSLGASPFHVFFSVALPLAWRSILSGAIMMFARGLSEFGAVVIIAYYPMVASVMIYDRFTSFGLDYARPISVVFILVCLLFFVFLRLLAQNKNHKYA